MNRKPPAARASRLFRGWIGAAAIGAMVVVGVGLAGAGCQRARAIEFIGYACGAPPPLPTVANSPWNCDDSGGRCFVDDNLVGLPGRGVSLFMRPIDPTTAGQPTIVYPLPGAMFPLNLGGIDLQWRSTQPYFRVQLTAVTDPSRAYTLYLPCRHPPPIPSPPPDDACYYPLSRALWTTIAAENPDGEIDLQIAGADPTGSTIAVSPPTRIAFSPSSVHGGIYYWSTDGQGIFRAVLGGGPGLPFLTPPSLDRFSCGGCHSVSDDGRFLAYSGNKKDYSELGTLTVVEVQSPSPAVLPPAPGTGGDGATTSLNRDGSRVLASFGTLQDPGHLDVRETATNTELARLDPNPTAVGGGRYFFPQWSPDGREIAATASEGSMRPWSVDSGSIVVLPYSGSGFGTPRVVVPQDDANGLFHYYPT
jgi:hypothetical protein